MQDEWYGTDGIILVGLSLCITGGGSISCLVGQIGSGGCSKFQPTSAFLCSKL